MNAWVIFMKWSVRKRIFVNFFSVTKINISTKSLMFLLFNNYYHWKKILVTIIGNQPGMNDLYFFILTIEKIATLVHL